MLIVLRSDQTFLLECADSLGAQLHADFLAVYDNGFSLQVWLPYLFGVALREADITAKLLSLAANFTFLHDLFL